MSTLLAPSPQSFFNHCNADDLRSVRSGPSHLDEASPNSINCLSPPAISPVGSCISLPSIYSSSFRLQNENTPPRANSPSARSISVKSRQSVSISPRTPRFFLAPERQSPRISTAPTTPVRGVKNSARTGKASHMAGVHANDTGMLKRVETQTSIAKGQDATPPLAQPEILQFSLHVSNDENISDDEQPAQDHNETADIESPKSNTSASGTSALEKGQPSVDETLLVPSLTRLENKRPFKRWISTLRRRHIHQSTEEPASHHDRLTPLGTRPIHGTLPWHSGKHGPRASTSTASSSIGFVTAMKSATISFASTSIHPRSWRGARFDRLRSDERSSARSGLDNRKSLDSQAPSIGPIMDDAAWMRSLQRRKVLEEIVASEESYIADLKVLVNVYSTLLASASAVSIERRMLTRRNLDQILEIHEELLGELHKAVPHAEFNQGEARETISQPRPTHMRFHSMDVLQSRRKDLSPRNQRHSFDTSRITERSPIALLADPQTAAKVAAVFNKFMKRFFAYEEYGAKYEALSRELNITQKVTPTWPVYEKGIEALSTALAPMNHRNDTGKKGLTLPDLLIKPIQRICKYPLLFADLCKQTPVYDDPESHAEIEKVLFRLRETAREINKATDDPEKRKLIEKTWQIQDRLLFEHQPSGSMILRLLGHVVLCGALHVAYPTKDGMKGQYMVCILYKSCILLAIPHGGFSNFMVKATIALSNATIETTDSGKGLQCHSAPFSWKLDFESGCRMYELILSACSAEEEEGWRTRIHERIAAEIQNGSEDRADAMDMLSSLSLDIKSYGAALGHPYDLSKRISVHRAATVSPKAVMSHVVIKNTDAVREGKLSASLPIHRSQSHLSSSHVPTLSPQRIERIRLERSLSNVWTKELIPYPGMATRRPEHPIRASAHSVMRKLSMASIASNFSKRSASYTSIAHSKWEDSRAATPLSFTSAPGGSKTSARHRRRKPSTTVDLHHSSMAFLPADFDLQGMQHKRSRRMSMTGATGRRAPGAAWSKPETPISTPTTPYPDIKIPVFGEQTAKLQKDRAEAVAIDNRSGKSTPEVPGRSKDQPLPSATLNKVSAKLKQQLLKLRRTESRNS